MNKDQGINALQSIHAWAKEIRKGCSLDILQINDIEEWSKDIINLLKTMKEQEVRELTIEEWQKWKENKRRDPICMLWENDTSPIWILKPEDVHEPALLMGKLKVFTGKPTFEQCKAVKWE